MLPTVPNEERTETVDEIPEPSRLRLFALGALRLNGPSGIVDLAQLPGGGTVDFTGEFTGSSVVFTTDNGQQFSFNVTIVPEPSTLLLVALGMLGLMVSVHQHHYCRLPYGLSRCSQDRS